MRLSDEDIITSLDADLSYANPMSQKLDPTRSLGSGYLYKPFLSAISLTKGESE